MKPILKLTQLTATDHWYQPISMGGSDMKNNPQNNIADDQPTPYCHPISETPLTVQNQDPLLMGGSVFNSNFS